MDVCAYFPMEEISNFCPHAIAHDLIIVKQNGELHFGCVTDVDLLEICNIVKN